MSYIYVRKYVTILRSSQNEEYVQMKKWCESWNKKWHLSFSSVHFKYKANINLCHGQMSFLCLPFPFARLNHQLCDAYLGKGSRKRWKEELKLNDLWSQRWRRVAKTGVPNFPYVYHQVFLVVAVLCLNTEKCG